LTPGAVGVILIRPGGGVYPHKGYSHHAAVWQNLERLGF
jgi:hypothetical protein